MLDFPDIETVAVLGVPTLIALAPAPVVAGLAGAWMRRRGWLPAWPAMLAAVVVYAPFGILIWNGVFAGMFALVCAMEGGAGC